MMIPGLTIPEPPHKHNYAMWVYPSPNLMIYADCSACGETPLIKPSYFCPNCGALMLNVHDARLKYESIVAGLKEKKEEQQEEQQEEREVESNDGE